MFPLFRLRAISRTRSGFVRFKTIVPIPDPPSRNDLAIHQDQPKSVSLPTEVDLSPKIIGDLTKLHLKDKTEEQLMRQKFDLTPLSTQEYQNIVDTSLSINYLLSLPQTPSQVQKLQKTLLSDWEMDLDAYFGARGKNIATFTQWIRGMCHLGRFQEALIAFHNEWRNLSLSRDVILYNSLLTGLRNLPFDEVNIRAREILALMEQDNILPDIKTYGTIIHAMVDRPLLTNEELDQAFAWMTPVKEHELQQTVDVFTSLVLGCVRANDPPRAWATFDHMRVWHCEPDFVMYTTMFQVCGMTGEVEKALDLYTEMKELDIYPTEVTFTSLISAFKKRPDMFREAMGVLVDMKHHGYKPDIKTWRALAEVISAGGDASTTELIFDEAMREFSVANPRFKREEYMVDFVRSLLKAYAKNHRATAKDEGKVITKNIQLAESLFNRLLESQPVPPISVCNAMLSVYAEGIRINRALEFREKISSQYGLQANKDTYAILVKMFARSKKLERAFDMFNQMKVQGMIPSLKTYGDLITGCAKTDYVMSGMRLLRELKDKGYPLMPHHDYVMNFRRNLASSPHLVREIDQLTGKANESVPYWKKVGGRRPKPEWREVSKEERKEIAKEPHFPTSTEARQSYGTRDKRST